VKVAFYVLIVAPWYDWFRHVTWQDIWVMTQRPTRKFTDWVHPPFSCQRWVVLLLTVLALWRYSNVTYSLLTWLRFMWFPTATKCFKSKSGEKCHMF